MYSIRSLYRIGRGPSASHTIGPARAASIFHKHFPQAGMYHVQLQGSLAATGHGHMTDLAVEQALAPADVTIDWQPDLYQGFHPNGILFQALDECGQEIGQWQVFSVGGGELAEEKPSGWLPRLNPVYRLTTMTDILGNCIQNGQALWEYVEECEGNKIWDFLKEVWQAMQEAIERGLQTEGILPGGLGLARKAWVFYRKVAISGENFMNEGMLPAYALATSEENANGGVVVTAPTCGSSGILPAVLRYMQENIHCNDQSILHALAAAGLIGTIVKHNASISGAEVGCQGEVGVACAMAAGAATQLLGGTPRQVEYAAEMGLEHHLGLTCDPVNGLVQIPCIERNVFASSRALSCTRYACSTDGSHRVSFDEVVKVMKQTGHDLPSLYRETAGGGLAVTYRFPPQRKPGN